VYFTGNLARVSFKKFGFRATEGKIHVDLAALSAGDYVSIHQNGETGHGIRQPSAACNGTHGGSWWTC
jgi:hypothetical protein